MRIAPKSKLVMIGDSITDCGRARPVAEAGLNAEALGTGYVGLVNAALTSRSPQRRIRVVNMGVGGNTVRDLAARWQTDVIALEPQWLSVMIGINDVWRQFDQPLATETHVHPEEYARTLGELVAATRPRLEGLVMMTPYVIEPNRTEPMRAQMDRYGAIVRDVAARHDAVFVDGQAAFDRVLESVHPMALAWDRVHPSLTGHMVLADAFLSAIGAPAAG
jgi:lysophospholipase L1-like esterase